MEEIVQKIDALLSEGFQLYQQGRIRDAMERFLACDQALTEIRRQIDSIPNAPEQIVHFFATKHSTTLNNIGAVYDSQGDLTKALEFYNRALKIVEANAPESTQVASTLNNIGAVYRAQGDLTKALEFYNRALKIDEAIEPNSTETATDYNNIGFVYQAQGDLTKALEFYNRALKIDEAIAPNSTETATRLNNIGAVYQAQGDLTKAIEYFERCVAVREALRERAGDRADRESLGGQSNALNAYYGAIDCRNRRRAAGDVEAAFLNVERVRARSLSERLAQHQYAAQTPREDQLLAAWEKAQGDYEQYYTRRQAIERNPNVSEELKREFQNDERAAKQALDALWTQIEMEIPAYAALARPGKALTLAEAQARVLDEGMLFLSYVSFGDQLIGVAASKESAEWLDCPAETVGRSVAENYVAIQSRISCEEPANELDVWLLPSAESPIWEGVSHVLIAPDGPLFYLPFEVLPRLGALPIAYAASATALAQIREREARIAPPKSFIGFGDPDAGELDFGDGTRGGASRLPHARREAENIAASFQRRTPDSAEAFCDAEATKARAVNALSRSRILHFACHGKFDPDDPFDSFLLLAADRDRATIQEKVLTARELLSHSVDADLVVCSACQTGLGERKSGEGMMGLTRAFLAAGARCVLVTLWSVNDRATRVFMESFYDFLKPGVTVDQALLKTRNRMRRGMWDHPFYWAAFSAYGDTNLQIIEES